MAVSKSALPKDHDKRIGRGRILSSHEDVILSNDTIKQQSERRLFHSG